MPANRAFNRTEEQTVPRLQSAHTEYAVYPLTINVSLYIVGTDLAGLYIVARHSVLAVTGGSMFRFSVANRGSEHLATHK